MTEASGQLTSGGLSAVTLAQSVLDRIDTLNGRIGAYLTVDREGVLQGAALADRELAAGTAGPLCGLPMALKDVLCTSGMVTTCGSRILENFVPPYDATVVAKLRAAGALVVGKVAMDEFAMGSTSENCAFGTPQNPWRAGYVPGGSSGGSAAAVAADLCLGSIGSDTGGSIRQPASLCGIVGLKPTYGLVSRYGLIAFASSLDQLGPMTKDVADCAMLLQVMAGHDPRDSTSVSRNIPDYSKSLRNGLDGMRVGVPVEYFTKALDPEVEKSVRSGIAMLRDAGAEIIELSLPRTEYCVAVYYLLAPAEASSNLARFDGVRYGFRDSSADNLIDMYRKSRSQGFGDEVKRRILIGTYALSAGYYDAYYKKASQARTLIMEDFAAAFRKCDVIASPVTPTVAWPIGSHSGDPLAHYLSDILTISANLAGIPGISVPVGMHPEGLPIGIQLQAAHWNEEALLRAAWNIEQRAGMRGRKPTAFC